MPPFKIEGIFGPGAGVYSFITDKNPFFKDFYLQVAAEVVAKLPSGRVLDIGTGPGHLPISIARMSPSLDIMAIDISQAMVEMADHNAAHSGLDCRIKFVLGSAESIPFDDGYFDLVISTLSLHHWADAPACMKEIRRVLKPGGEAWIYDIQRDVTSEGKQQLYRQYGRLVTAILLYFVRAHSSMGAQKIKGLLAQPGLGLSSSLEDRGFIFKLCLK